MNLRIVLAATLCAVLACGDSENDKKSKQGQDASAERAHDHDGEHAHDADEPDNTKAKDAGSMDASAQSAASRPNADAPPAEKDGKKLYAIRFDIRANDKPFRCGTQATVGTKKTSIQPVDARFFVHDVTLVRAQGERVQLELYQDDRWQRDNVALLDFADDTGECQTGDKNTRELVYGYADEHDDYTSVAFSVGVPPDKNHLDAARSPAPYNTSGLWWSWSGGYKYTRLDVTSKEQPIWYFHLGAANCNGTLADGYKCAADHIPHVELPDYNPTTSFVVWNLDNFYAKSDLTVADATPGCMSFSGDDQCQPLFDTLGIIAWKDDAQDKPKQTAFVLATGEVFHASDASTDNKSPATNDPNAWPNASYERPKALDVSNISKSGEKRSHPPDDPRYNVNCMRCHQEHGPGLGRFTAAGTVNDKNGKPATFAHVEIFSGTPMGDKVQDFVSRAKLQVDDNGNFFTTEELPKDIDLGARILDGSDKLLIQMPFTQPTTACNTCHTGGMRLTVPAAK